MISKEHIITLSNLSGIGQKTVSFLVDSLSYSISSSRELIDLIEEGKKTKSRIKVPTLDDLDKALFKTDEVLRECEKLNIDIISLFDKSYPERFKSLDDKPTILYYKGNKEALNTKNAVAIIGTREPTNFGMRAGKRLAEIFTKHGFVVVSGLAKGCDTVGHEGCLNAGGKTVAVLASGVDYIYPKENRGLAERILNNEGGLISEYAPKVRPQRSYFVERDRLQSGLSQAVIVIETDIKGGSMHTAGFAEKQGRKLACLGGHPPELINDPKTKGISMLIQTGRAKRLSNPDEINDFIFSLKENFPPTQNEPDGTQIKLF